MKRSLIAIGCALAIVLATDVALAQGKGGGPKPKVSTGGAAKAGGASHAGGAKSHAPTLKSSHAGGQTKTKTTTAKVNGPKSKTTTTAKVNGPKSKTTTTTAKATDANSKSTTTAKNGKTSTTTTTTTTTTTGSTTLTKVQQKLQQNTKLASKLEGRLPKGTDLMTAAEGFRNLGQFVAAVNVSNNLGLDFDLLKTAMVDDGMSLGQAIKDQRTSVDGTTEATRAQRDADTLIRSTETTSTSGTSATTAKTRKAKDGRS